MVSTTVRVDCETYAGTRRPAGEMEHSVEGHFRDARRLALPQRTSGDHRSGGAARSGVNLELKVRLDDAQSIGAALRALGAAEAGVLVQRDTYFRVPQGRLKLRETPDGAELIAYERDERGPALHSRYTRTPVERSAALCDELTARYGLRGVVKKTRALWLYVNARIHLDAVAGLGAFLEIEVVDPRSPEEGEALLNRLVEALSLDRSAAMRQSYIDLLDAPPAVQRRRPL